MIPRWKATPSKKNPGWLVVIGRYDPRFIDDLKAKIMPRLRVWDPSLKAWRVHESAAQTLDALINDNS